MMKSCTFDEFVLPRREEIRVASADRQTTDGMDVACEGELEPTFSASAAFCKVPNLCSDRDNKERVEM